jgi:hypothetical protein
MSPNGAPSPSIVLYPYSFSKTIHATRKGPPNTVRELLARIEVPQLLFRMEQRKFLSFALSEALEEQLHRFGGRASCLIAEDWSKEVMGPNLLEAIKEPAAYS